ncbi:hypothetical protein ACH4FX_20435 [Streptomyces sp. NPDC018019]|uniref:hypothetical protein n=1 Tax=Streptomyces sp. NPDC018019 TaxID=3365030 RepID=UPI0037B854E5
MPALRGLMAHADRIEDLGPGAGHGGGRVFSTDSPAHLVAGGATLMARYLREYVGR